MSKLILPDRVITTKRISLEGKPTQFMEQADVEIEVLPFGVGVLIKRGDTIEYAPLTGVTRIVLSQPKIKKVKT